MAACTVYTWISKDTLGDGHGVVTQFAGLEKPAEARGWQVAHRLCWPLWWLGERLW